MPAILVASKMKSGLPKPKPVHSALPIPQTPSRPSALALPPAPLKTHIPSLGQKVGSGPPRSNAAGSETGENTRGLTELEEELRGRIAGTDSESSMLHQCQHRVQPSADFMHRRHWYSV
ncbi:neuron navigator 2 isoform X1 [Lates japonicus]|uniref:Neuron navigator 2 isoform X1 n=1 Tax=Lates japonicus TaxID=270547 RepID=A0AAD3NJ67_LATJO|nr:neuron navigator 2 isoform X1 [Lates japonicus]GLD60540.1 neuron navigator 2 isoform X1 [Lates japonicus]GLD72821.1 neuron navigator 2 isoform X1 [Lates japonicus]GLD73450.1 neuron navigator 2 isoform X1 [Lates japonicus]GLD74396.1 neuron navigator 2 isoform X1 [Lates japonicus]